MEQFKYSETKVSAVRALASGVICAIFAAVIVAVIPLNAATAVSLGDGLTASAKTVSTADNDPNKESAPFPDLKVTVSQTANLLSQGLVVSYTGLKKSMRPSGGSGGANFLQIAQCWREDPLNPGHPDRTSCQYGIKGNPAASRDNSINTQYVVAQDSEYSFEKEPGQSYTSIPFRAITGEVVTSIEERDGVKRISDTVDPNENQFFTALTTNFVPWAGADDSGAGQAKFEAQTVMQSPALGCGAPIVSGATAVGQSCWLVIIPRGTADNGQPEITSSGLFWDAWKHNIAFKLDFRPVGVRCEIGGAERQLSGSELISVAVASWQPKLCAGTAGSAFVLSTGNETDSLMSSATAPSAPLALTTEPLAEDPSGALVYAPVAMTGISVSFAIDRYVKTRGKISDAYKAANLSSFGKINLTPRLLAKLLTASYLDSLPPGDKSHIGYLSYLNLGPNAQNLTKDPDFLAVNDLEWQYQSIVGIGISDVGTPLGRSDLANRVWEYIMADEDARDFMAGKADPWGMRINPWFCTDDLINPTGIPLAVPRRDFPKADPIEKPDTSISDPVYGSGAINLVTYRPYLSDFETGAYKVLRGDSSIIGLWDVNALPPAYKKSPGALQGNQKVLALTTLASAAKYQNVSAALLNPAGFFVYPTKDALASAQSAMTPTVENSKVSRFDFASEPAKAAQTAYPLAMPVYAAANPSLLDDNLRAVYSNFIRYAATQGQISGTDLGQLPPGYAPLSEHNVQQAMESAYLISQGLTNLPTPVPTYVPTTSPDVPSTVEPSDLEPSNSAAPVVIFGAKTPIDPSAGPLASVVPFGFMFGAVTSLLYSRLGRRRSNRKL